MINVWFALLFVAGFAIAYFIVLENLRRGGCKKGIHHFARSQDGTRVCRTCGKEVFE